VCTVKRERVRVSFLDVAVRVWRGLVLQSCFGEAWSVADVPSRWGMELSHQQRPAERLASRMRLQPLQFSVSFGIAGERRGTPSSNFASGIKRNQWYYPSTSENQDLI
jgi:hypothetical protein